MIAGKGGEIFDVLMSELELEGGSLEKSRGVGESGGERSKSVTANSATSARAKFANNGSSADGFFFVQLLSDATKAVENFDCDD